MIRLNCYRERITFSNVQRTIHWETSHASLQFDAVSDLANNRDELLGKSANGLCTSVRKVKRCFVNDMHKKNDRRTESVCEIYNRTKCVNKSPFFHVVVHVLFAFKTCRSDSAILYQLGTFFFLCLDRVIGWMELAAFFVYLERNEFRRKYFLPKHVAIIFSNYDSRVLSGRRFFTIVWFFPNYCDLILKKKKKKRMRKMLIIGKFFNTADTWTGKKKIILPNKRLLAIFENCYS